MVFLASSVHIYVPTFALIGSGRGEKVYSVKMGPVFSFVLLFSPYFVAGGFSSTWDTIISSVALNASLQQHKLCWRKIHKRNHWW